MIKYFEYFYHRTNSDMDFRPEWPVAEASAALAGRNAMICSTEYCAAGYSPTNTRPA